MWAVLGRSIGTSCTLFVFFLHGMNFLGTKYCQPHYEAYSTDGSFACMSHAAD